MYLRDESAPLSGAPPAGSGVSLELSGREREDSPTPHLTLEELAELRQNLINRRERLAGEIARLQNEACWLAGVGEGGGGVHGAGLDTTDARAVWERGLRLSAIAHKRSMLHEVDRALERIENNTYGRCAETQRAIPVARLREIPWARLA